MIMKSAFELAMERLGTGMEKLTAAQKKQLAQLSSVYEAKIAQAKIRADEELRRLAADPEKQAPVRQMLATDLARLGAERDSRKDELRRTFKAG